MEDLAKKLRDCFKDAEKDEKEGKKHKGLLVVEPNDKYAREYIQKARIPWIGVMSINKKEQIIKSRKNGSILFIIAD